ncbi:TPA: hypothetical protein RU323_004112 [Yersinia enterocolitica]|nr:hypothetical protein [Yersinia enterocolitica]HDV0804753.1 hypothetical protein [Yersinia enterocolitica]HDZ9669824.1 hypothetical protein [Yersinia enterocolitica]
MLSEEELEHRAKWPDGTFDKEAATELLSLREQLAELKQQKPIGQVISCNGNKTLGWINDAPVGTLLFTAAKPADSVTLPAPANYEDYGPMVSLEKTMAALALCGIEYTVKK